MNNNDKAFYDRKIAAIEKLLKRIPAIEKEIRKANDAIDRGNFTVTQFEEIVRRRTALYCELETKERKLKEDYKVINSYKLNRLITDSSNLKDY